MCERSISRAQWENLSVCIRFACSSNKRYRKVSFVVESGLLTATCIFKEHGVPGTG